MRKVIEKVNPGQLNLKPASQLLRQPPNRHQRRRINRLARTDQPGNRNANAPTKDSNQRYPPVDGVRHTQHFVR